MCFKRTQSEPDITRVKKEEELRAAPPRRPGSTTRPRGNGEADRRDVERSLEKLTALVGR